MSMTIDESLQAMAVIEDIYDGTPESAERVSRLAKKLVEDPENFWTEYVQSFDPDHRMFQKLWDAGFITKDTPIPQAIRIIDACMGRTTIDALTV